MLIDASRMIWRLWTRRLPTGIDRVCLAYLAHFGPRAQAVLQWKGVRLILCPADSQRLFALLAAGGEGFRWRLVALAPGALARARTRVAGARQFYLNLGHTGLDAPDLPGWAIRSRVRPIYLIHDLIPINNPEFCRAGEHEKHRQRMLNTLNSAAGVIANSQVTLDELRGFAREQAIAMPPGTVAWLAGHPAPARVRPAVFDRPTFVTIGTIEGRKNHILLLRLWRRLAERMGAAAPRLLIIGQRGWEADHALAMLDRCAALAGHVEELGACDDHELLRLVAGARALLMPSFAEGFGLPVVEALALGTPVIAADLPVFREIVGDIPTYLPSWDGIGWEEAVLAFTGDCPERARQLARLPAYRPPDWAAHFAAVEAWLGTLG